MATKLDFLGIEQFQIIVYFYFRFESNFSSPHLIEARERIRINGELLSKEKFVDYFWRCYKAIQDGVEQSNDKVLRLRFVVEIDFFTSILNLRDDLIEHC